MIEGKQVYNFTKALKKQYKKKDIDTNLLQNIQLRLQKRRRRQQAEDDNCDNGITVDVNKGLEYLKQMKINEGYLKTLYKKAQ